MSYFGEQNQGNERSNSISSSSRRGKKSSNLNKNKQPQRGLGVAQLEKIRLQSQYGATQASYLHSPLGHIYPNHTQMGLGELERGNIRCGDSQSISTVSWIPGNVMLETQQFAQPNITRHFFNQVEDAQTRRKEINDSVRGSSSQNSETSETQEVDLELRL